MFGGLWHWCTRCWVDIIVAGPAAPSGKPLVLAVLEAVNPDLASLGMSGWGRGRRGRAGVASLLFVESWLWNDALNILSLSLSR